MNTWVTFNLLMRQKKSSMKKIIRLMLDEVIMLDRHMSHGQLYSFLQPFFNTEKINLTWRLDGTVKCEIHYPFKWIQLNGNVKIG